MGGAVEGRALGRGSVPCCRGPEGFFWLQGSSRASPASVAEILLGRESGFSVSRERGWEGGTQAGSPVSVWGRKAHLLGGLLVSLPTAPPPRIVQSAPVWRRLLGQIQLSKCLLSLCSPRPLCWGGSALALPSRD